MALFHLSVTQTKRSAGQSAIASAAYRAGERLYSEYYGEYSDYTRKGGVICSDILLPSHAPPEYADRQTLWNAVEKAERGKNAQLAYSFDIALQNEFSLEENIALLKRFVSGKDGSRGTPEFFRARFYRGAKIRSPLIFAPAGILLGSAFPKPCYAPCRARKEVTDHAKEIQYAPPPSCGKDPHDR